MDTYQLALAVSRGGRLVRFERRMSGRAVRGGMDRVGMFGAMPGGIAPYFRRLLLPG